MSDHSELQQLCEGIRRDYSPCDVSDALLKLGVPAAGYLKDIVPIPSRHGHSTRIVAPISTVLFVPKSHTEGASIPGVDIANSASNLPKDVHWTDVATPGSVVLMQQPPDQIVALVGDIVATRYRNRGMKGVFVDGRTRDVVGCGKICEESNGEFTVWSKALSSVGTSLEAKPWAVDVPISIKGGPSGDVVVNPGDVLVADEAEGAACVIPREKLKRLVEVLPTLKQADDGVLEAVRGGADFKSALQKFPQHYTNPASLKS